MEDADLLRILMETMPDYIYFKDRSGRFMRINRAQAEILGVKSESEAVGRTDFDFFTQEHAKSASDDERSVLISGKPIVNRIERVRRADGEYRWMSATKVAIRNEKGDTTGIVGISRDITDLKLATDALSQNETYFRSLFEGAKDAIYITEPGGRIVDINPAGVAMLGYETKEELLCQANVLRTYARPEDRARLLELFHRNGSVNDYETTLVRKDGSQFQALITGYVFYGSDRSIQYRGIIKDISERKRREAVSLRARKMTSIGNLTGRFAHEFNNILGGIQGYLVYLKTKIAESDPLHGYLERMELASRKASRMIEGLLVLSHDDSFIGSPVDLNVLLSGFAAKAGIRRSPGVRIETKLGERLPPVCVNPDVFERVIFMLYENAVESMPAGGVFSMETSSPPVYGGKRAFAGEQESYLVEVSVSDTGEGMSEDVLEHLFEPFFSTKGIKDRGLSLWFVYNVVQRWNGAIEARSKPGNGARFLVTLPVCEAGACE